MDDAELSRLRRRFGDDIANWPAPHRQEARNYLTGEGGADAGLHAALMQPTNEGALAQAVLTRIAAPPRHGFVLASRPTMAGYAMLLLAFGGIGYGNPFTGDSTTDTLLAIALGDALPALVALP